LNCEDQFYYKGRNICRFRKKYAEGSTLHGFLAEDYVNFKNSRNVKDPKLTRFNEKLRVSLKLKAEFGCTTKETGLFND